MNRNLIIGLIVFFVLVAALGLGLGLGIKTNKTNSNTPHITPHISPQISPIPVPTPSFFTHFPPEDPFFDMRFYNNTQIAITIWLEGSQPPCSVENANQCNTKLVPPETPADYRAKWLALANVFEDSGTKFEIGTYTNRKWIFKTVPVLNSVDLTPEELLIIHIPKTTALKDNTKEVPIWAFSPDALKGGVGTKAWATVKGADMPASESTMLYEYNFDKNNGNIFWDLSAVDGINTTCQMNCGKDVSICATPLDTCPYPGIRSGYPTCLNPKFKPEIFDGTLNKVQQQQPAIWNNAGQPSNIVMCSSASGDPILKQAYHVFWAIDDIAVNYLHWLQRNSENQVITQAYGWAYDEFIWKNGDTFDKVGNPEVNGNPSKNDDIAADKVTMFSPGKTPLLTTINFIMN
jgi:hypothetical protein